MSSLPAKRNISDLKFLFTLVNDYIDCLELFNYIKCYIFQWENWFIYTFCIKFLLTLLCLEPRYELIILKCIYLILTPLSFIFITSLDIICKLCYSLTINKVIDV